MNTHFPSAVRNSILHLWRQPISLVALIASMAFSRWAMLAGYASGSLALQRHPFWTSIAAMAGCFVAYVGLSVGLTIWRKERVFDRQATRIALCMLGATALFCAATAALHAYDPTLWYAKYAIAPIGFLLAFTVCFPSIAKEAISIAFGTTWSSLLLFLVLSLAMSTISMKLVASLPLVGLVSPTTFAYLTNALLLLCLTVGILSFTNRPLLAAAVAFLAYTTLVVGNVLKLKFMHSAVEPLDLQKLHEFMPHFSDTFGVHWVWLAAAALLAIGLVVHVESRVGTVRLSLMPRLFLATISASIMATVAWLGGASADWATIEALGIAPMAWNSARSVASVGALTEFVYGMPYAHAPMPEAYSRELVNTVRQDVGRNAHGTTESRGTPNVILYFVESLGDTTALRLEYTREPIPVLRSLDARFSHGGVITPGRFGDSANSEFEALTGFSLRFLPPFSVPYNQHLKHQIPSALPCVLRDRGYRTGAVLTAKQQDYNREEVYPFLCIDNVNWLGDLGSVERDVTGRYPSDNALVDALTEQVRALDDRPYFLLAFNGSTHFPYNTGAFSNSPLHYKGQGDEQTKLELDNYGNLLHGADEAIGALLERLQAEQEETVVIFVGDHLPPLTEHALRGFYAGESGQSVLEVRRAETTVPIRIWSNFPREKESLNLSMNYIPLYVLDMIGGERPLLYSLLSSMRQLAPVVSGHVEDTSGRILSPGALPADLAKLLKEYEVLQYDLLLGEQYLLTGQ